MRVTSQALLSTRFCIASASARHLRPLRWLSPMARWEYFQPEQDGCRGETRLSPNARGDLWPQHCRIMECARATQLLTRLARVLQRAPLKLRLVSREACDCIHVSSQPFSLVHWARAYVMVVFNPGVAFTSPTFLGTPYSDHTQHTTPTTHSNQPIELK